MGNHSFGRSHKLGSDVQYDDAATKRSPSSPVYPSVATPHLEANSSEYSTPLQALQAQFVALLARYDKGLSRGEKERFVAFGARRVAEWAGVRPERPEDANLPPGRPEDANLPPNEHEEDQSRVTNSQPSLGHIAPEVAHQQATTRSERSASLLAKQEHAAAAAAIINGTVHRGRPVATVVSDRTVEIDVFSPRSTGAALRTSRQRADTLRTSRQRADTGGTPTGAIARTQSTGEIMQTVEAPEWVPDTMTTGCGRCGASFSIFCRRHHCRNCGGVFCNKCCNRKQILNHQMVRGLKMDKSVEQKVCVECFYDTLALRSVDHT